MSECQVILNNSAPLQQIAKVVGLLLGAATSVQEKNGMNALLVHDASISLQTYTFDDFNGQKAIMPTSNEYDINHFMPYYALKVKNILNKQYTYTINMHSRNALLYTFHENAHVLNIALFTQLVNIFGGELYYKDEHNQPDVMIEHGLWQSTFNHFYSDGENFLRSIKPLNAAMLRECYAYATYKNGLEEFCQHFDAIYLKKELEQMLPESYTSLPKRKI